VVILHHGLQGTSHDMTLLKNAVSVEFPHALVRFILSIQFSFSCFVVVFPCYNLLFLALFRFNIYINTSIYTSIYIYIYIYSKIYIYSCIVSRCVALRCVALMSIFSHFLSLYRPLPLSLPLFLC
jgi:hypothetical protein